MYYFFRHLLLGLCLCSLNVNGCWCPLSDFKLQNKASRYLAAWAVPIAEFFFFFCILPVLQSHVCFYWRWLCCSSDKVVRHSLRWMKWRIGEHLSGFERKVTPIVNLFTIQCWIWPRNESSCFVTAFKALFNFTTQKLL